jgi:AMMECR1 domain-containing protein
MNSWQSLADEYNKYLYEKSCIFFLKKWVADFAQPGTIIHSNLRAAQWCLIKSESGTLETYAGSHHAHLRLGYDLGGGEDLLLDTHDLVFCSLSTTSDYLLLPRLDASLWQKVFEVTSAIITAHINGDALPEAPPTLPQLKQSGIADVTLWVDGNVRGSIVVQKPTLQEAILVAAEESVRDGRFAPIQQTELVRTTIEIILISDFFLPLRHDALQKTAYIDHTSAYRVTDSKKTGWYLPTVPRTHYYEDRATFLNSLAYKKAGISLSQRKPLFFQHPTVSAKSPLLTIGQPRWCQAVIQQPIPHNTSKTPHGNDVAVACLIQWISNNQRPEGYWPLYTSPYEHDAPHMDWVRNAALVWALAELGAATNDTTLLASAAKADLFLGKHLPHIRLANDQKVLSYIYLTRAAVARKDTKSIRSKLAEITERIDVANSNIFISSHLCSLLQSLKEFEYAGFFPTKEELVAALIGDWKKASTHPTTCSLATYAELIPVFHNEKSMNPSRAATDTYNEICDFVLSYQKTGGAFPNTPTDRFVYTRGTSKLAEALAVDESHRTQVEQAIQWVWSMQVLEEDLYAIPISKQHAMRGGIRHDYANHTAWIDSAAHTLIAIARQHRWINS